MLIRDDGGLIRDDGGLIREDGGLISDDGGMHGPPDAPPEPASLLAWGLPSLWRSSLPMTFGGQPVARSARRPTAG